MPKTVRANKDRQVFVTWKDVLKVIDVEPNIEWKAIIALARLTGARVPSELYGLTWNDINFETRQITIRSPKTEHHGESHASRICPLFVELLPYLESLFAFVQPEIKKSVSPQVFALVTGPRKNLATAFSRMVKKAGLEPWPKLFTNMRSSRETELQKEFSPADVCNWFGHSPIIAAQFYA